jgi:hypothetical protein
MEPVPSPAHLTLGAHLLLWVFPLALTIWIAVDAWWTSTRSREGS